MPIIRKEQMEAFERERLVQALVEHVAACFPVHAAALGPELTRKAAERAVERAARHGITDAGDLGDFLAMTLVFGDGFPDAPEHAWAREVLDDPAAGSAGERVARLRDHTMAMLQQKAGRPGGDPR